MGDHVQVLKVSEWVGGHFQVLKVSEGTCTVLRAYLPIHALYMYTQAYIYIYIYLYIYIYMYMYIQYILQCYMYVTLTPC